jgi:sporulation protein YlmC with PRC-barrel domain
MTRSILMAAALGIAAGAAFAQPSGWDPAALYRDGLSARQMLDAPVRADDGRRIGEVKDIIVDRQGRIRKVVVEVGGFFELGDQHIGVPWKDVKIGEDMAFVQVPLREVEQGKYSIYGEVLHGEDVPAPLTSWRVNELIGDYARMADVPRYGLVIDVIFSSRAEAKAVVIERGRAWGDRDVYAFPFTGFDPAVSAYPVEQLVGLKPFDYALLGKQSIYAAGKPGAR